MIYLITILTAFCNEYYSTQEFKLKCIEQVAPCVKVKTKQGLLRKEIINECSEQIRINLGVIHE